MPYKYRPARETNSVYKIEDHALADTQRAIRMVRMRAAEWNINPDHMGVMGFFAGGELVYLAGMKSEKPLIKMADAIDRQSDKPNFQGLIYPEDREISW